MSAPYIPQLGTKRRRKCRSSRAYIKAERKIRKAECLCQILGLLTDALRMNMVTRVCGGLIKLEKSKQRPVNSYLPVFSRILKPIIALGYAF